LHKYLEIKKRYKSDEVMKVVKEKVNGLTQVNVALSILYNMCIVREDTDPLAGLLLPPLHMQVESA
jgi:hypothetical protein